MVDVSGSNELVGSEKIDDIGGADDDARVST